MTDLMSHRGPDDRGTFTAPGVAFGVRRLSIVDVEGGHQPFFSEDGQVCGMQNGELYNHAALRDELVGKGHRFSSRCDTEILPHLYEAEGDRFVERLRGKFGLAVWDGRRNRAVIARDRLGVKPLYWARIDDLVVFASELKSLLASGLVSVDLDDDAIEAYLTLGFVPGPHTPLKGIRKLLPGHQLIIDGGAIHEHAYWRYPRPRPDRPARPLNDYTEELLQKLREAVHLRLMSDVPLGAMLSGGLDSSLVVALMAEELTEPVKTFSVGFREDAGSELHDARTIASLFGTDHHELELSFLDDTVDLPELVWHLDEPVADLSALGLLALSQLARQHVTVALSGQGADELFAGYERYRHAELVRRWRKVPDRCKPPARALLRMGPKNARRAAEFFSATGPVDLLLALNGRDRASVDAVVPGGLTGATARILTARFPDVPDTDPVSAMLFLDAQLALPDDMLHYFDRTSMAHSLEVRVPFLDHELVEWAATVPSELKVRGQRTKHVLKEAASQLLPATIVDKPKIGFFNRSLNMWFERQAPQLVATHLSDGSPKVGGLVDLDTVRRHATGSPEERRVAFRVLILELWLQQNAVSVKPATSREHHRGL
jgi:asparagine synthase (glutamine-hydrolysing)